MKRVVLDTNVLVSALLVPGSVPARIFRMFRDNHWILVVSGTILEEYGRILRRPRFRLNEEEIERTLKEIESRCIQVIPKLRFDGVPEDSSDNEFLDVAVEADADLIVSGDHHLLDLKVFRGIPILPPAEALRKLD